MAPARLLLRASATSMSPLPINSVSCKNSSNQLLSPGRSLKTSLPQSWTPPLPLCQLSGMLPTLLILTPISLPFSSTLHGGGCRGPFPLQAVLPLSKCFSINASRPRIWPVLTSPADIQSPWGSNGWRRSTILVKVPTGKKPTAASRRMATNTRARNQRHDEVDPDADPFPVYRVPIHDVRTRSLSQSMLEYIQDSSNSTAFRWYGSKEVWQPPYHDAPPEQVWGELYTSDVFLSAERDLINAHSDSLHPSVIAAFMIWSDSTHLAQFGQAKAWPIYAYFGNQSKYTRCKPSTRSAQVVGYVPPVSDY
jgi:hypothetical protein